MPFFIPGTTAVDAGKVWGKPTARSAQAPPDQCPLHHTQKEHWPRRMTCPVQCYMSYIFLFFFFQLDLGLERMDTCNNLFMVEQICAWDKLCYYLDSFSIIEWWPRLIYVTSNLFFLWVSEMFICSEYFTRWRWENCKTVFLLWTPILRIL